MPPTSVTAADEGQSPAFGCLRLLGGSTCHKIALPICFSLRQLCPRVPIKESAFKIDSLFVNVLLQVFDPVSCADRQPACQVTWVSSHVCVPHLYKLTLVQVGFFSFAYEL